MFQPSQARSVLSRNGVRSVPRLRSRRPDGSPDGGAKLLRLPRRLAGLAVTALLMLDVMLFSPAARAESLWRDAQLGMSPAQVSALYPAARAGNHRRLNSGATNELSLSGYAIGNDLFSVDFFFLDGRLEEAIMRLDEVESRDSQANQAAFERLVDAAARELGRPSGCQATRNITLFRGCQWQTKEVRVDIVFLEIGGQGVILNAYYRPRATKT